MKAFFFGDAQHRLFGVYHPPVLGDSMRSRAVLLCYPGVEEYSGAHWAFRRLAGSLARRGCHVLRFDYFGTGDSSGELEEATLERWTNDVVQAAAELRDMSACRRISIVGMRLGAAVAMKACQSELKPRSLILWDPVVSGADYQRELHALNVRRHVALLHGARRSSSVELSGYRVSPELQRAVSLVDLCRDEAPKADAVSLITSSDAPEFRRLHVSLEQSGRRSSISVVADSAAAAQKALVSNEILKAIVEQLSGGGK